MPTTIDLSEDYLVWDNTSQISYSPIVRGATPTPLSLLAKRRAITTREMMASNGVYVASDVKFLIPAAPITDPFAPKPGDEIEDDDGTVYTVLEVPWNKAKQTYHAISRNLAIANDLRDTITIQKAARTQDSIGGVVRDVWSTLYASVSARLQPQDASIADARGVEGQEVRFTIPVSRQLPLLDVRECRVLVVSHDYLSGRVLDIERFTMAEQIGELPRIEAVLRP